MIKFLIGTLALTSLIATLPAAAAEKSRSFVNCEEKNREPQMGYTLGLTHESDKTFATLYLDSRSGPTEIDKLEVRETETGLTREYSFTPEFKGRQFNLIIQMESFVPTTTHPATIHYANQKGTKIDVAMSCYVPEPIKDSEISELPDPKKVPRKKDVTAPDTGTPADADSPTDGGVVF